MKPFADLLERLLYTPQRNVKIALMLDYFRQVSDPDRGYGLAALTGALTFKNAKAGLIRDLVSSRTDPVLFGWSYDFVGDLAETAALLWPEAGGEGSPHTDWPRLHAVVQALHDTKKSDLPDLVAHWLDTLDANGRWALLKLVTGSLRVGVSARLAKLALADYGHVEPALVEEVWHLLDPPYETLFAWLDGKAERPATATAPVFRPLMLAHPIEAEDRPKIAQELDAYWAEWKWDGIRVQIVAQAGQVRLYSRTGDDISATFPEITQSVRFKAVLDGEMLVGRPGGAGIAVPPGADAGGTPLPVPRASVGEEEGAVESFNDLQQRLGRKLVSPAMLERYPAFVRLYDILFDGTEDLRSLPLTERRARLEAFMARERPLRMDLSPLVPMAGMDVLDVMRKEVRGTPREGLMLKRRDSPYLAGRPKGYWWKWKREAHLLDCVVMYAQRGHGKRSSFYSDYTFGCWREGESGPELVPVGKAYSGFTDEELQRLDRWIREHTVNRYGPVREVAPGLVLEVAFDSAHRSNRHKSGVAMRFPRVNRIRWDKPAAEADLVSSLIKMIEADKNGDPGLKPSKGAP
jgi:DNA ligase-1